MSSPTVERQRPHLMALTFDDLPIQGPFTSSKDAAEITERLLQTLKRHDAPAIGFVNESQLDGRLGRATGRALLKRWIDAGFTLGNHTYSHPDLNAVSIDRFKEEIVRGEPVIRELMADRGGLVFFRHPMTHSGDTREKKDAVDAFLASRGYTIAPHTIENSDFIFNLVYVRALGAGDGALAKRVRNAYIEFTFATTGFAEKAALQLFGRDIPQVLLLHANRLNTDVLDEILARYSSRDYRFVPLGPTMGDPAYQTPDTAVFSAGPTWLWRWARTLGKTIPNAKEDPEPPAWILEAYKRR
jgi:peptidoglycan-N-acetylglucosamine deacetylase